VADWFGLILICLVAFVFSVIAVIFLNSLVFTRRVFPLLVPIRLFLYKSLSLSLSTFIFIAFPQPIQLRFIPSSPCLILLPTILPPPLHSSPLISSRWHVESGAQPLIYADGKKNLSCAVNGEIYNWKELRDGLKSRDVPFVTGSDCEVIMHLVSGNKEEEWFCGGGSCGRSSGWRLMVGRWVA
jgi:hypothetical protein